MDSLGEDWLAAMEQLEKEENAVKHEVWSYDLFVVCNGVPKYCIKTYKHYAEARKRL